MINENIRKYEIEKIRTFESYLPIFFSSYLLIL
jgi:hypothetical protein